MLLWHKDYCELEANENLQVQKEPSQSILYQTKSRNLSEMKTAINRLSQRTFMAKKKMESWCQDGPRKMTHILYRFSKYIYLSIYFLMLEASKTLLFLPVTSLWIYYSLWRCYPSPSANHSFKLLIMWGFFCMMCNAPIDKLFFSCYSVLFSFFCQSNFQGPREWN